jgi:membrane-associated phospholipid phosphatase
VIITRMQKLPRNLREHAATWGNHFMIVFAAVALSGLVTNVIKPFIARARPILFERENIFGFHPVSFNAQWNSMPSGHSTTAFTLAFTLSMLFPRYRSVWWVYGIALALSRVMVNAHYLSDVLAGGAVAFVTTFFIKQVLTRYGMFHAKHSFFPIDRK